MGDVQRSPQQRKRTGGGVAQVEQRLVVEARHLPGQLPQRQQHLRRDPRGWARSMLQCWPQRLPRLDPPPTRCTPWCQRSTSQASGRAAAHARARSQGGAASPAPGRPLHSTRVAHRVGLPGLLAGACARHVQGTEFCALRPQCGRGARASQAPVCEQSAHPGSMPGAGRTHPVSTASALAPLPESSACVRARPGKSV